MKNTLLTLFWAACLSHAATLTNTVVSTQFVGPSIVNNPIYRTYGDFRPVSNTGVVNQPDGTQEFSSHYGAVAAIQTNIDSPGVALQLYSNYRLTFTVLDPTNSGYSLTLGHSILGFINAGIDVDNSLPGSGVGARYQGITVEWLDPDNSWIALSNLELSTNIGAQADVDDPLVSRFIFDGATETAFALSGTRDFQFRFNFQLQAYSQPGAFGEAAIRLGLDPGNAIPSFVLSNTPGPDGTSVDQLGHFVTLSMQSFGGPIGNEVPEPSTVIPMLTAIGVAIRLKYRK